MSVSRLTHRLLVPLLVSVAALLVPTAAFADCAHEIIDQAYKGKITKSYSQACYNAAIKIEPVDGSSYSDIDSIIKQAKHSAALAALAADSKATTTPTTANETPRTQVAQANTTTAVATTGASTTKATVPTTTSVGGGRVAPAAAHGTKPAAPTATVATTPVAPAATLLGAPSATPVLDRLAPAHADDVPVAVIVLGVLAVLLVLAGVAGAVVRRRAGRTTT